MVDKPCRWAAKQSPGPPASITHLAVQLRHLRLDLQELGLGGVQARERIAGGGLLRLQGGGGARGGLQLLGCTLAGKACSTALALGITAPPGSQLSCSIRVIPQAAPGLPHNMKCFFQV